MKKIPQQVSGLIYVTGSAFMYATMPLLGKFAFAAALEPSQVLLLRFAFSFMLLAPYLILMKKNIPFSKSPLVWLQGVLIVADSLLYFHSLLNLSVNLVTVLLFSYPAMVALMALVFYKEKLSWRHVLTIILALTGVALVSGIATGPLQVSGRGMALVLGAAFCYALYSLLGQKTLAYTSPLVLTSNISLLGILLIPLAFRDLSFLANLNWQQLLIGMVMGLMNTVLAISLFLKGVQKIGASQASLVSIVEPVITIILAYFLLHEELAPLEIAGALLVFTSMFISVYIQSRPTQQTCGQLDSTTTPS